MMAQPPSFAINQLNVVPGDVAQLEIALENASTDYTAFQFDLTLPDGVSIKKSDGGQLMVKLNDERISDHQLHAYEILSNTYRVLGYSMSNANITGTSGTLIIVTLEAESDISLGTAEGYIDKGLLVADNNGITELETNKFVFQIVEKEYSLIYNVDGKEYKSYKMKYGEKITPEAAPEKEGYSFSGWSDIPQTMPANDVTVTGSFKVNKYRLFYMVDGAEYKSYEVEYGAKITPEPAPSKEGYTFSGWSDIPSTMPVNDVTVTGSFKVNKYKLTYMVDGAEYKSYEMEYGAKITPEPAPTKEDYSFSGWSEIPQTMPANDVTVTGSFKVNKYRLVYMVDGAEYKSYEVEYGAKITHEAAPEKEGYTFSGWSDIPNTMPANDVTVTGSFKVNKYRLVYMVDGAEYKSYEVEYGAMITPEADPVKEGYSFSGWSDIPSAMPANDVIVTGSFIEITGIISVINDSPGALIYDMQGRRIDRLQKGVNIIHMNHGGYKKVVCK